MRSKMDSAYKLDEGYSEDTRSEDGSESSLRIDTGGSSVAHGHRSLGASIEDALQGLNAIEKSGMLRRPLMPAHSPCSHKVRHRL